jgi:sec-independent protein translocase protein TatC
MMKIKKSPPPKTQPKNNTSPRSLLKDHFSELFHRLYWWIIVFIIASIIGFFYSDSILYWLIAPLHRPLFYTSPVGGLEAVLNTSVFFGFVLSLPILIYQLIKFIEPACPGFHRRQLLTFALISLLLALLGVTLSYYLIFPAAISFLNSFGSAQLLSFISTREYFSFIMKYLVGFAILFQLPLVIYLLSFFISLTPKLLIQKFKHVVVFSFILAAILTPTPDFINQTIMAAPIIGLYLLSVLTLFVRLVIVNRHGPISRQSNHHQTHP